MCYEKMTNRQPSHKSIQAVVHQTNSPEYASKPQSQGKDKETTNSKWNNQVAGQEFGNTVYKI